MQKTVRAESARRQTVSSAPPSVGQAAAFPRKVLYLVDTLTGEGGTESALAKMASLLPSRGWDCTIGTFRLAVDNPAFLRLFNCPIVDFTMHNTYGWTAWKTAWRLRRFVAREKFDVVHTMFPTSDLWGGVVATTGTAVRLVSGRRDMGIVRSAKHARAYRFLANRYHQVQAVSEATRLAHIHFDGLKPERVFTVHNGIEMDTILNSQPHANLAEAYHLDPHAPTVLAACGNIWPVKGVDIFIRAAALVCKQFPRTNFLIAGEDHKGYAAKMHELIRLLGLENNVKIVGIISPVFPVMLACDIFCQLSRSEGLSNALLEAMACGLPCIASNVGGNPEVVVDGESGFLVPSEDPQAAANRILELLNHPDLREKLGRQARLRVQQHFTADRMADRIVELYDQAIA